MPGDLEKLNGSSYCKFHDHCKFQGTQMEVLNEQFKTLNSLTNTRDEWIREYVNHSMPIKSHFWILLGSLSILSAFAAIMRYIEKIGF